MSEGKVCTCGKRLTGRQTKFCSKKCSQAKVPVVPKVCEECGGVYLGHEYNVICPGCRGKEGVIAARAYRRNKEWQAGTAFASRDVEKVCEGCGETFMGVHNSRHCSFKCRDGERHRLHREEQCRPVVDEFTAFFTQPDAVTEKTMKYIHANTFKGLSIDGSTVAACYYVAKRHGSVISLVEVADWAGMTRRQLFQAYKSLFKSCAVHVPGIQPSVNFVDLIARYYPDAAKVAGKLWEEFEAVGGRIGGHDPKGFAAALTYAAFKNYSLRDEHVTQWEICESFKITEVTLRYRLRTVLAKVHHLRQMKSNRTWKKE